MRSMGICMDSVEWVMYMSSCDRRSGHAHTSEGVLTLVHV